jgi:hypothetical protein
MARSVNFFTPKTAYEYSIGNTQNFPGQKNFVAPNPPYGAELVYRVTSGSPRDSARIVVTNIRGDTVRTLNGAGGPGLHRAYWDLRGRPRPLGPAALRDSINTARIRRAREDSVRAARADTSGGAEPGPRRGRGGAQGENLRPAEAPTLGPATGGEGGGFFGGGRQGNLVDPGDYAVTINVGGQSLRQIVHVERVSDIINFDFGPESDDGEDP